MTIEERATESATTSIINKYSDAWYINRNGFIKGATEQKAIDIDKACEWLTELFNRDDYGLGVHTEKVISRFRKAMEQDTETE